MSGAAPVPAHTHRLMFASTSYPRDAGDWRGVFMRHLAFALARRPDVELSVWAPPGELPPGTRPALAGDDAAWLESLAERGGMAHLLRSRLPSALLAPVSLLRRLRRACRAQAATTAYFINWLQNALALPDDGKPAVITALGTDMKLLKLPGMVPLLRRTFARRPCVLCPNAEWMEAPLREAFADVAEIRTVHFGVDPVWFGITRIPPARARWLAVTRLTPDKLGPLFEWAEPLFSGQARELHLIGPAQADVQVPPWVHFHGPQGPKAIAKDWFPSATGLITLSRHSEGLPQVVLEAMAASLPVLASPLPAHQAVVEPGRSGWLVTSPRDFAEALAEAEVPATNLETGAQARELVRARMGTWDDCVDRYIALLSGLEQ